jgi:DNA-binding SARP family transcriptional activator
MVMLEKVRPPEPNGLIRERLHIPLLATGAPGLTLIVAPPGSGKTTLLTQIAATSQIPTAWYGAGPEDTTEAALVRHLSHAIAAAEGDCDLGAVSVEELVICTEAWCEGAAQIIVDDLHEIEGTDAERALERFLRLRPRRVRVLLGSRRPPGINTSRLLASGSLCELGGDDLRFRSWEVEELFRRFHGQPLTPEAAAALTRGTGGWAAGLQLFHLSTRDKTRSECEAAIADLSGRSRLIRSYLTRNVLAELPDERRSFLFRTCTLGVLTGALCDTLLGTRGSAGVLEELEHEQFFTTTTDDGKTFRYHEVLRSHLEALLPDEIGAREAKALYWRSATVLEQAGHVQEALRAFGRAEDWGSVARLIKQTRVALPVSDDQVWRGVARSSVFRDDAWMTLGQARRLLKSGAVEAAAAAFQEAAELLDDPDFRQRCAGERALATLWLPHDSASDFVMESGSAEGRESWPAEGAEASLWQVAAVIRNATRRICGPEPEVADLPGSEVAAGVVLILSGRLAGARQVLARTAAGAPPDSWERLCAVLATALADFAADRGVDLSCSLEEVALAADLAGQPWVARIAHGVQMCVLLAGRPEQWRATACRDAVDTCHRDGDRWGGVILGICAGVAHARVGDDGSALSLLAGAAKFADTLDAPVLGWWAQKLSLGSLARTHPAALVAETDRLEQIARELGLDGCAAMTAAAFAPLGSQSVLTHGPSAAQGPPPGGLDGSEGSGESGVSGGSQPPSAEPDVPTRLACLGGFRLEHRGREVDLSPLRPRARALLLLLAINHGRNVHREQLIDALWPDVPLVPGTRRLQVAASSVRQLLVRSGLGDRSVQRRGDAYRLELSGAVVDVELFEDRLRRAAILSATGDSVAALREQMGALEMYSGDLLPEVGPAEWVVVERNRLRVRAATAAADAARLGLDVGRFGQGLCAALRSVQLDPLRDTAWLVLADLQERLGDHSAAAVTRREHALVCAELESVAGPDTKSTAAGIRSGVRPPGRDVRRERA